MLGYLLIGGNMQDGIIGSSQNWNNPEFVTTQVIAAAALPKFDPDRTQIIERCSRNIGCVIADSKHLTPELVEAAEALTDTGLGQRILIAHQVHLERNSSTFKLPLPTDPSTTIAYIIQASELSADDAYRPEIILACQRVLETLLADPAHLTPELKDAANALGNTDLGTTILQAFEENDNSPDTPKFEATPDGFRQVAGELKLPPRRTV